MDNLVIRDEYEMTAESVRIAVRPHRKNFHEKYKSGFCFFSDSSFLCDYMMFAFAGISVKYGKHIAKPLYVERGDESDFRKELLEEKNIKSVPFESLGAEPSNMAAFVFADCVGGLDQKDVTLASLKRFFEIQKNKPFNKCIISVVMPEIPAYPENITALAERELDYWLEEKCEKTPGIEYYLALEKLCREAMRDYGLNIVMLRFTNVFSPDHYSTPSIDIEKIVTDAFEESSVTVTADDLKLHTSLLYVRDACAIIIKTLRFGVEGNIYNSMSREVTAATLKELIYSLFPDELSINKNIGAGDVVPEYNNLSPMKLEYRMKKRKTSIKIGVKHVISYLCDKEYDISENTDVYCGKIETIQKLEIDILSEIDRICQKHGINYFLAGGTLLGAVREGQPIPWDDDLDIGMLRGDYEKFRKVCEEELGDKFLFSSPFNKSGSHYTIEKVRIKDTYFSTKFSSKNIYQDGIFVDVLIYDQTSNVGFLRKIQVLALTVLYYSIILKWFNKARRNYHYRFTKIVLPILRCIPFPIFHHLFDLFAKASQNNKNAKWLVDSVGKKLKDGVIQLKGLDEVVYVDFAGIKAPIPVDPKPYLTFAYGPDYMNKPVYGKRICPHNFGRIDLGGYLFGDMQNNFRSVDLRGELYEDVE